MLSEAAAVLAGCLTRLLNSCNSSKRQPNPAWYDVVLLPPDSAAGSHSHAKSRLANWTGKLSAQSVPYRTIPPGPAVSAFPVDPISPFNGSLWSAKVIELRQDKDCE
jgi:hypothetical protein